MMEASTTQASLASALPCDQNLPGLTAEARRRLRAPFTLIDGDQELPLLVDGRVRWALGLLLDNGAAGLTSRDYPGARLSDYVFKLRGLGVNIETIEEAHHGEFPGRHGRYFLRSKVVRRSQDAAA
jgi:hypothetical protein